MFRRSGAKIKPKPVHCCDVGTFADVHNPHSSQPILAVGTNTGVELWHLNKTAGVPKIFGRVPTPIPRLVHLLAAPRGTVPWPPSHVDKTSSTPFPRPLIATVAKDPTHSSVEIYSVTTKECVHVIHFGRPRRKYTGHGNNTTTIPVLSPDDGVQPRRMRSNGTLFAVGVGHAVHIFSIQSFKHIRTFLSEPGAQWSAPFALGTRLLAVPSHGRKWSDLQHVRLEEQEQQEQQEQQERRQEQQERRQEQKLDKTLPDAALLGSMSTASWTKVDVAMGMEQGLGLGKMGANYVVNGVKMLIGTTEGEVKEGESEEGEEGEESEDDGIRVKRKVALRKKNKKKTKGQQGPVESTDSDEGSDFFSGSGEEEEDNIETTVPTAAPQSAPPQPSAPPSTTTVPTVRTILSIGVRPSPLHKRKWPLGSIAIFDLKAGSLLNSKAATTATTRATTATATTHHPNHESTNARGVNQTPVASLAPPPSRGSSQSQVACVAFSPTGNQLSVAFEDGREVYVLVATLF